MIYELQKNQYKYVFSLLDNEKDIIDIKAVLETNNPGLVFADSYETPKTALIWTKNGAFLVGDANNKSFNDYFEDLIYCNLKPILNDLNYDDFDVGGTNDEWNIAIEEIFKNHKLNVNIQIEYKLSGFKNSMPLKAENGMQYSIVRITEEMLNKKYSNIDFLTSGILVFWDTIDDFLKNGFGWCVTHEDLIISRCTCDYIYKNKRSIGIATHKDYRRKGFARLAALECIKQCLDNNFEVYWDCTQTNTASVALAESLGFIKEFEYKAYWFIL